LSISTSLLRDRQNIARYNWGFRFALWCALLWGMSYLGLDIMSKNGVFIGQALSQRNPFYAGYLIALMIVMVEAVISTIWAISNNSLQEWWQLIRRFDRINLQYLLCAVCGGSIAWLSFVAANLASVTFSVAMVMFYPIIGTLIARLWYREKIFKQGVIGLIIIGISCACLYLPEVLYDIGNVFFVVFLIGILVGFGWSFESAIAARAMDATSASLAVSVRFIYEAVLWIVISLVIAFLHPGSFPVTSSIALVLSEPRSVLFLSVAAVALTFNYYAWYQSFLFCGVCRGLAVSDISGFVIVMASMILLASQPSLIAVFVCLCMFFGVFLVYYGQASRVGVLRAVDLSPVAARLARGRPLRTMTLKSAILVTVAEHQGIWDYELAEKLTAGMRGTRIRNRRCKQIRLALVEAAAAGLVVPVEDAIDNGNHFGEGALISNYRLTAFGRQRLLTMRLLRK